MTKEELETREKLKLHNRAKEWLRTEHKEGNVQSLVNLILSFTELKDKQIQIDAEQIRALQKQNGELTDRVKELEAQIEKMKWHDLRKDPNDLPKESCSVLVTYEYDDRTYTDNYINDKEHNIIGWESEYKDPYCAPRVIAWSEKPMFKEIKEK